MQLVPREVFLTKGVGVHAEKLVSFELALRAAGIALCNLVPVSSILPPRCEVIAREEGLRRLQPGAITFCVLARMSVREVGQKVSAAIGLAIPENRDICGYISEHHGIGWDEQEAAAYAQDLAHTLLTTAIIQHPGEQGVIQVPFDEAGKPVLKYTKRDITQFALTERDDTWTTVVASAVFLF
jgi:arginine decarboxylase